MEQVTFADVEYEGKKRRTRRELFGLTPFWWTVESGCFCDQPKSGG